MSNDSTPLSDNQENYSNSGSWALGVVVPQNSQTDKGKVQWQNVVNVTVVFRAPNITRTDGTIYLVMSLMTSTGAVIQAAAGLYQNMSEWGTYGMDILHPSSYPQDYNLVVGKADPGITSGQLGSMSLFLSSNNWNLKLADLNSSKSVSAAIGSADILSTSLKIGDQFVFALESYTSNSTIFENMGNLTLESLLVDGARVTSGPYGYFGWDNVHYPLFSVGGASLPSFVALRVFSNASAVWSYSPGWSSGSPSIPIDFTVVYLIVGGVAALVISLTTLVLLRRKVSHVR